ncbi:MAG TPA: hypothetical protein VJT85_01245 [Gemmatimonadaceae bacterium]|nr:hypothetical protein [Gemmatimonadaceae bacterium]
MYAGHAAVALALRRREPRLPILPLVIAAFGPDWLELLLMLPEKREGMAVFTHSVPAVLIGGALAAMLYSAIRRPGAGTIFLAWLLHWPADLFTGRKPLLFREPLIGLDLYKLPAVDFALESMVVVIGCALYARTLPPRGDLRRVVVILGAALIAMQGALDVALSVMRNSPWAPSFVLVEQRSQPRKAISSRSCPGPHASCTSPLVPTTRGSDGDGRSTGHRDAGLPHLRQGEVFHTGSAGSRELRAVRQHGLPDVRHTDRARRSGDRRARGPGTQHGVWGQLPRHHAR